MKKKPKRTIWIVALAFGVIYFCLLLTEVTHNGSTPTNTEHHQEDLVMPRIKPSSAEPIESASIPATYHLPLKEDENETRTLHTSLVAPPTSSPTAATTTTTTLTPIMVKSTTRERQNDATSQPNTGNQTRSPLSDSSLSATLAPTDPSPPLDYNGTNSFAACLMWMDDYERLIEWIAYHYHVLPLRHLVIFKDPNSHKDPTEILERWKPFLEITLWTNISQFTFIPQTRSILSQLKGLQHYKKEQGLFYRNCLNHLKQNKWTWTYVGDTDEFLVLNENALPVAPKMMEQPGIMLKTLKAAQTIDKTLKMQDNTTVKLINSKTQSIRWGDEANLCLCLKRQQFSGFESPQEAVTKDVPAVFDPYRFQTVRFRYHRKKTIIGKCIIDASRVSVNVYTRLSQHMLIRECGNAWGQNDDLMNVNHYLGTWDYFDRPNDIRGKDRYKTYMKKNLDVNKTITKKLGDTPRKWLASFLQNFGEENALAVLKGVGFPYNNKTALPVMNVTN